MQNWPKISVWFKACLVLFFFLSGFSNVFSQNQTNNWYFGNLAGVTFASGSPVAMTNSSMVAWGGCAAMSDSAGNLICYTNGSTVYNKNHAVMANGANLMGDYYYGNYGPSVVIVPRPGTSTTYYIFSINRNNTATGYPDALRYSTVIITLNGGDGGVTNRNYILSQKTFDAKITATKHANGIDYWVIVHEFNTNKFYAFLVTNAGVSTTPVISSTGRTVVFPYTYYWWSGSLKASPDGKKIASSYQHYYSITTDSVHCEVFDFNNTTGSISNPVELTISKWGYYYYWGANGIEFSPDGSKIYLSDHSNYWPSSVFELYQFDLKAGNQNNIQNSRTKVGSVSGGWYWWYSGGMQLAKDGKIYVTRYNSPYLGVVNAPNQKGIGCCYQDSAVWLTGSRYSFNGLPQFVTSWFFQHPFDFENVCFGKKAYFTIANKSCLDSVFWDFGDSQSGTSNFSKSISAEHLYSKSGKFTVSLTTYRMGTENIATREIEVFPMPDKKLWVNDTFQCLAGNYFKFIDSSTINNDTIVNWHWKLGDIFNFSGKKQDTSASFSVCDTFTLKLYLTTKNGCIDSITKNIWINPEPTAAYYVNKTTQCFNGHNFIFSNASTIEYGTMSYQWQFGDSTSSAQINPQHQYQNFDTFTIKLITVSNAGCDDTTTGLVYLHPSPKAKFSIIDSNQCLNGNLTVFKDSSTINNDILSYDWNFGDGNKLYVKDTSHTYLYDDTFDVRLKVTSSLGCSDSMIKKVIINPNPKTVFTVNDTSQCLKGNIFIFTNKTTINTGSVNYQWYFGDNATSNSLHPQHSYASDDTFTVKLVSASALGCSDSISAKMIVFPMPFASFNINDSDQCYNEHYFNLSNSSLISSGSLQYNWNLGDGNTSLSQNINNYRYNDTGNYHILLVAKSNNNCFDSVTKRVVVYPSPKADFSIDDSTQCLKWNKFSFLNNSSISNGSYNNYWKFGDGSSSSQISPVQIYNTEDTFNVELLLISNYSCRDSLTKKLVVHPSPVINIGINDTSQCFQGNNFIFYNNTSVSSGSIAYRWFFGDGDSSQQTVPSHSYSKADTFDVLMISKTNLGCSDSISLKTIVHVHPMPNADFSINDSTQCFNTNSFVFTNNSSISSGSMTYLWYFDDMSGSNLANPVHSYLQFDTFDVKLLVMSNWDCRDSSIKKLVVFPKPDNNFIIDDSARCFSGNQFIFTNKSSIASGSIASFKWFTGDGKSFNSANLTHSYILSDTFDVMLTSVSALDCRDTFTKKVIVHPMPKADFNMDTSSLCLLNNKFNLTGKSTISSGSLSDYYWNMGDSTNYILKNISHTYQKAGSYNVKYLVVSSLGCSDSIYKTIAVFPMPVSDFSINDSDQCFNEQNIVLNDKSSIIGDIITTWYWKMDTSLNATYDSVQGKNPKFSMIKPGTWPLQLVTKSSKNCRDTLTETIIIFPSPDPLFTVNDTHQCLTANQFTTNNLSSILSGNMSYYWSFGDNSFSTQQAPSHSYSSASNYLIKLVTESDKKCKDSVALTVFVHPMPFADFSFTQACLDTNISFNDLSDIKGPDIITQWLWDFGGSTSNLQNPVYKYVFPGIKKVRLDVSTNYNCKDDTNMFMLINPHVSSPYLTTATVEDNKDIMIKWEAPLEGKPIKYYLESSLDGINFYPKQELPATEYSFLDRNKEVSLKKYTYKVKAEDSCHYIGNFSNPGRNILLQVNDTDIFPVIRWSPYESWPEGVLEYHLEIYDDKTQLFEPVESFTVPVDFVDEKTEKNQEYLCYRIVAQHSIRNDISSVSNTDCIPTTLYAFVPNAFSPNNDGLNDTFIVVGKNIMDFNLVIFDSWGKELYRTTDPKDGWDGQYSGNLCPMGVYYYQISIKGSQGQRKYVSGTLHLIR